MLSYYLLPTTRRLPITQYIIQMSSISLPENPILGTRKSSSTQSHTIFPLIFHWVPQLLRLISGAWTSAQLRLTRSLRFITFTEPATTFKEKMISVDGVQDYGAPDAAHHPQQVNRYDITMPSSVASSQLLFKSSGSSKATATSIFYRPHTHIRSQKLLMSVRRQRVKSKLATRPRINADTLETDSLKPRAELSHELSPSYTQFQSTDITESTELSAPLVDNDTAFVSSPASTTATLVESTELPTEILPSDSYVRSPALPSAQLEVSAEEPLIDIATPAPIRGSDSNEAQSIPRPSSKSPPPLPRINTGTFTRKGSFRVRITDKGYCKWHNMVFQHRNHPDEKMASYFKHLHESEEELLEIQRIASLGPVPKEWDPKYQQIWFDWIAKQDFRTWSMTHYSQDRPGV